MINKLITVLILATLITACEAGKKRVPGTGPDKGESPKTIEVESYYGDITCGEYFETTVIASNCTNDKCTWEISSSPSYLVVEQGDDYVKVGGTVKDETCSAVEGSPITIDVTACDSYETYACGYGTMTFEMDGGGGDGDDDDDDDDDQIKTNVTGVKSPVTIGCGKEILEKNAKKAATNVSCSSGTCAAPTLELPTGFQAKKAGTYIKIWGSFEDYSECNSYGTQEIDITVCDDDNETDCATSSFELKTTAAELNINISSLEDGQKGVAYTPVDLNTATTGSGDYTWKDISADENCDGCDDAHIGLEKAGLKLSADGIITGTPDKTGKFKGIVLQVTDNITGKSNKTSPPLTLTILDAGEISVELYSSTDDFKTTTTIDPIATGQLSYENITIKPGEKLGFKITGDSAKYDLSTSEEDIKIAVYPCAWKQCVTITPQKDAIKSGELSVPSLIITIKNNFSKTYQLKITNLTFEKDPCSLKSSDLEIAEVAGTPGKYELAGAPAGASVNWYVGEEQEFVGDTECSPAKDLKCTADSAASDTSVPSCLIDKVKLDNFKGCNVSASSGSSLTLKKTFKIKASVTGCPNTISKKVSGQYERVIPALKDEYIQAVHVVSEFENVDSYCKFWTEIIYGDQYLEIETPRVGIGSYEEGFMFYTSATDGFKEDGGKEKPVSDTIFATQIKKINLVYDDNNDEWTDMDYKTHVIILTTENYYYPLLYDHDDSGEVDGNYETDSYKINTSGWKVKCGKAESQPTTTDNNEKSSFDYMKYETCGEFDKEGLGNGDLDDDCTLWNLDC